MKSALTAVALAIAFVISALSYYGLFTKVKIGEKEIGNFWLVYEKHVGDYKNTGQVMEKIYSRLLGEDAIEPARGFGLYYDNPQKVEKDKLRSVVGCILDKKFEEKAEYLKKNYRINLSWASSQIAK